MHLENEWGGVFRHKERFIYIEMFFLTGTFKLSFCVMIIILYSTKK